MLGPGTQVAMLGIRALEVHVRIVLEGLVDVAKTWRNLNTFGDGEAQAHGFVRLDVGILADDHYFEVAKRHVFESIEDKFLWRIDLLRFVLSLHEIIDLLEGRSL